MKKLQKAFKVSLAFLITVALLTVSGTPETAYALQPTKQSGTGTYKTSTNGFYSVIGYSMMFGNYTTSIALDDVGFLHESETTSPKYSAGFTVVTLSGNERRARGSNQVIMSDGSKKYLNYEIRINPANFNKNSLVKGRSLLDNLYLESGVNKSDLDAKLANGGTAWINAIVSVRTGSQKHSVMTAKRLWSNGKSNYTYPTRVYTRSDVSTAVTFSSATKNILKSFYDNKFTFPKIEEVDDTAPSLNSDSISALYSNGSNYYVRPGGTATITVRQYDAGSGNKYQYLRLLNAGNIIVRSRHDFSQSATHKTNQVTSSDLQIVSARRTENTKYGKVVWEVSPKKDGIVYAPQVYFQDLKNNTRGYIDLGKTIRADGVAPSHNSSSLTGAQYVNGNTYWVKPNTALKLSIRQHDATSGNYRQYLKILGGSEVRASHNFREATTDINAVSTYPTSGTDVAINSAKRTESTAYGKVEWTITPKTSGKTLTPMYHFTDNVNNANGYDTGSGDLNMTIKTDGVAPVVTFGTNGNSTYRSSHSTKVTVSDSLSGVNTTQYAWSTSNTTAPTSWKTFSSGATITTPTSTGTHYLWVKATDKVGNTTTTKSNAFKVDNTDPTFSANPSSGAWKNVAHVVTPTFNDGHSGVSTKQYAWSTSTTTPTTWSTYSSGSLTQPGVGTYYLHYKVVDNAGNSKQGYVGPYRYETTKPTATITKSPNGFTNGDVTIHVNMSDLGGSGVKSITTPGGTVINGSSTSFTVSKNGNYSFVLTDVAGNTTTVTATVDNIDKVPPTLTLTASNTAWTNKPIVITAVASDEGGIKQIILPNGDIVSDSRAAYTVSSNGEYTFVAYDKVGNTTTKSITISNYDDVVPTLKINSTSEKSNRIDVRMEYGDH